MPDSTLQNRLVRSERPKLYKDYIGLSLGSVGLNPPFHTQHNEVVGGCNKGNPMPQLGG